MIAQFAARHQRHVVIAALAAVAGTSLALMFRSGDLLMAPPGAWTPLAHFLLMFVMWWTMMLAMMLPSAAPAILLYGAIVRKNEPQHAARQLAAFTAGYAIVWAAFSVAAVLLHYGFEWFVTFDGMMETQSLRLGGALLVAAGVYQLTPWKHACLRRCQSPLQYFAAGWRKGSAGALRMGLDHGLFCVGCCAVLMGLLFYGGVMDLWWIGGLALYVLVEKLMARGPLLSRATGGLLVVWGTAVLWQAF